MVTKAGYSQLDVGDPEAASALIARGLVDQYQRVDEKTRVVGRQWYPKVQAATAAGVQHHLGGRDLGGRALHPLAGPGIVAAVSPNMDWEKGNINALGELSGLSKEHWGTISDSAKASSEQRKANKAATDAGADPESLPSAGRSPEATELLKGSDISQAPDVNLLKAHRILKGEHPESVITAPKTFSFMHNINGSPHHVTVDGRAHDMAVNQMRPWTEGRGIGTATPQRGGAPSRYTTIESGYKQAAQYITAKNIRTGERSQLQPHHLQAILWEYGKQVERQGLTKSGQPRTQGAARVGQPYFPDQPQLVAPRLMAPRQAAGAIETPTLEVASSPALAVGRSRGQRRSR